MKTFTLLGHVSPSGKYPSMVLPVGLNEQSRLIVLYQDVDGAQYSDNILSPATSYTNHGEKLRGELENFEPEHHRLFARTPEDVELVSRGSEKDFLASWLGDSEDEAIDPFVRLSFAKQTGDVDLVTKEVGRCIVALKRETPAFLEEWVQQEMRDIALALHSAPRLSSPRRRILLIEDLEATASLVQAHFEAKGYEVMIAADGLKGVGLSLAICPDMIILDLHLPKMDGFAVLKELRYYPETNKIPVVVWSQYKKDWDLRSAEFPEIKVVFSSVRTLIDGVQSVFLQKNREETVGDLDECVELLCAG